MVTETFPGKKPITEINFSLIASIMPIPGRIRIRKERGTGTPEFLAPWHCCDPAGRLWSFDFFHPYAKKDGLSQDCPYEP
jgi:hypothetical protein